MRFVIGASPHDKWQVLDDDGNDITEHLAVTRLDLRVRNNESTKVEIEAYNEKTDVSVLPEGVTVNLFPLEKRTFREGCLEKALTALLDHLFGDGPPEKETTEAVIRQGKNAIKVPVGTTWAEAEALHAADGHGSS